MGHNIDEETTQQADEILSSEFLDDLYSKDFQANLGIYCWYVFANGPTVVQPAHNPLTFF